MNHVGGGGAPAGVLRWDDDVESLARLQELAGPLQALRGVQKGSVPDAEVLFGLGGGEHRPTLGQEPVDANGQCLPTANHVPLPAF